MLATLTFLAVSGATFSLTLFGCRLYEKAKTELGGMFILCVVMSVGCSIPAGMLSDHGYLNWIPHHNAYALACFLGLLAVPVLTLVRKIIYVWFESKRRIDAVISGKEPASIINDPY